MCPAEPQGRTHIVLWASGKCYNACMRIIGNLSSGTWEMVNSTVEAYNVALEIGFVWDNGPLVEFDNLSFGYNASSGDKVLTLTEPAEGISYVSTDQEYVGSYVLADARPGEDWSVEVWAENAGVSFNDVFAFNVPKPQSPYPSWVWNDETHMWQAPIPRPTDGRMYAWDEDAQAWVEIVVE